MVQARSEALCNKAIKDTGSFYHVVLPSLTRGVDFICTVKVGSSSRPHPSQWKGESQSEGQALLFLKISSTSLSFRSQDRPIAYCHGELQDQVGNVTRGWAASCSVKILRFLLLRVRGEWLGLGEIRNLCRIYCPESSSSPWLVLSYFKRLRSSHLAHTACQNNSRGAIFHGGDSW